jgi:hypothetical protein
LHQIEVLLSESWHALRGRSRYPDVPPLAPSAGLIAEALLDRSFTIGTAALAGSPDRGDMRRMRRDLTAAHDLYAERGWLEDPAAYHQEPEAPNDAQLSEHVTWEGTGRRRYRLLRCPSSYRPHDGEPGAERWLAHPRNGTLHAQIVERDPEAPWLVCVHGFGMGAPLVNLAGFGATHLHDGLGVNLAFPVLPLHGARGAARMSGSELLRPDYVQMVHLFANATHDVRRLLRWLRARGARRIGLYGISLGAYVASLVAALEDGLSCIIAGIPAVDFPSLARDNESWVMRSQRVHTERDWQLVRKVTQPVSPLALPPRVPRERRFIYAGIADRVVRPDQPSALWRHWERPEIHWFSGGHMLGMRKASVAPFVARSLAGAGMARLG